MSRDNEKSLGEAIRGFLRANQLDDKLLETEIYQRWEELAGRDINLKTKKITFSNGHLKVYLTSATLRQELNMRRTELMEKVNLRLRQRPVQKLQIL